MAFHSLLIHRCDITRMDQVIVDGTETFAPRTIAKDVRCRVDLQYIRPGRDPQWTPDAGRPTDRTGVWFAEATVPIKTGDRIVMKRGPAGTFLAEGSIDAIYGRKNRVHHIEVGIKEVPGPIARANA